MPNWGLGHSAVFFCFWALGLLPHLKKSAKRSENLLTNSVPSLEVLRCGPYPKTLQRLSIGPSSRPDALHPAISGAGHITRKGQPLLRILERWERCPCSRQAGSPSGAQGYSHGSARTQQKWDLLNEWDKSVFQQEGLHGPLCARMSTGIVRLVSALAMAAFL